MKVDELCNMVNQSKASEENNVKERAEKVKKKLITLSKSKVQAFLNRMSKDGKDYNVDLEESSFESYVVEFLDSIPDEILAGGIFPQCCFIPKEKVSFKKENFKFCLEKAIPSEDNPNPKFFFPYTLKIMVENNNSNKTKDWLVSQIMNKVKGFLDWTVKEEREYCINLEESNLESYAKEFVESIPDEIITKGISVRSCSIPEGNASFMQGVFNFVLEKNEPTEENSKYKPKPYVLKVQVLNYGKKIRMFYNNVFNLYPNQEFFKNIFNLLDDNGKMQIKGMEWDAFLDFLEANDGDALKITECVYAYGKDKILYMASCNLPLAECLNKDESCVFDIHYDSLKRAW